MISELLYLCTFLILICAEFSALSSVSQFISQASVSLPVNDLQSPSPRRFGKGEVDDYRRVCLKWSPGRTEGIIVLHVLPLDSIANHLARWEQQQERAQAGGWLVMCICLCPTWLCNAWWKWRTVKMHYVLCSFKDICPPCVLLMGRPSSWGVVQCPGELWSKKTQYMNIQIKTTVRGH